MISSKHIYTGHHLVANGIGHERINGPREGELAIDSLILYEFLHGG